MKRVLKAALIVYYLLTAQAVTIEHTERLLQRTRGWVQFADGKYFRQGHLTDRQLPRLREAKKRAGIELREMAPPQVHPAPETKSGRFLDPPSRAPAARHDLEQSPRAPPPSTSPFTIPFIVAAG